MKKNETGFLDLDVYGSVTGEHYYGQVEVRLFLTYKERIESSKQLSRTAAGIDKTDPLYYMLQTISILGAHLVTKPQWWQEDGLDMIDPDPIYKLAELLREAQLAFAKEKSGGKVGGDEVK